MTLITLPPIKWPVENGWLDDSNSTPLSRMIVSRSALDDGICEVPLASNRGTRLDAMVKRAGLKPPVWWCAVWVGCVYADCGLLVPNGFPACDAWLPYMDPSGKPKVGAAILYGVRGDAHHIGIVTRLSPQVLTREGNRAYAGTTNDGVAVDQGPPRRADILGYVYPERLLPPGKAPFVPMR